MRGLGSWHISFLTGSDKAVSAGTAVWAEAKL